MAKIDKETLGLFRDPDDLVGYIALHRYEPDNTDLHESEHFRELPQHLADIIYILDFETLFNVEGLFAFLENTPGKYLPQTVEVFERTGNSEIAQHLAKVQNVLDKHGVTTASLHEQALERVRLWKEAQKAGEEFEPEITLPELREDLEEIEEALYPVMDECDYWENVKRGLKL